MHRYSSSEDSFRADRGSVTAIVILFAFLLSASCTDVGREAPPNIAIIMLDTARPDLLSAYGHPRPTSPFLRSFTAQGTRYDRAYSSSSWTLPAHGSLFTGTSPKVHGANQTSKRVSDSLPLLPEELREAGYQTAGFSANMWVSDLGGLHRGFQTFRNLNKHQYGPHIERLAADQWGKKTPPEDHYVVGPIQEWLSRWRDPQSPFFLFVNLVEPHLPYLPHWEASKHFLPSPLERWSTIQRYFPRADMSALLARHYGRQEPLTALELDRLSHMYEGTIRVVDELAANIIAAVDRVSDPADTLIFVVSDHGENLGDHGHLAHYFNLYDSNLRIVCIARGPGFLPGRIEEHLVHITDLHATVLRAAGLDPGTHSHGVDLRREIPSDRVLSAFLEYPHISLDTFPDTVAGSGALDAYRVELAAAIGPRYKMIRAADPSGRVVREEVYDLLADPGETESLDTDLIAAPILQELRATLVETGPAEEGRDKIDLDGLSPDALEGLRKLGYLRDGEKEEPNPQAVPPEGR